MAAIDNLIDNIKHYILFCAKNRSATAIKILCASQNADQITNAVAGVSFELSNGCQWPVDQISEGELNERRTNLIHELYFRYMVLVEIYHKPWPQPGGDFVAVDSSGFNRVYVDMDIDDKVRLALGDV